MSDGDDRFGRRTNGRSTENNEGLSNKAEEQTSGATLRVGGSEEDRRGEDRGETNNAVDNRRGDSTRMGTDDKEHGNGSQPVESQEGNEPSISSRSGRLLSESDVQPVSEPVQSQSRPSENDGDGNDYGRIQILLIKFTAK